MTAEYSGGAPLNSVQARLERENPQSTEQWRLDRLGKVTASRVADIVARTRTGFAVASRANYEAQLIVERLTGIPYQGYINAAMQWGIDNEPIAREAYENFYGLPVEKVGFIDHPTISMTGASPDGQVIGTAGLVEIKCPNTATHIETLLGAPIEKRYITQMQWQMACTGRRWCDFVSFDPRLPLELQIKIQCVDRDEDLIEDLEREVSAFLKEIDEKMGRLKALSGLA